MTEVSLSLVSLGSMTRQSVDMANRDIACGEWAGE
jgi:hypothetical protein